ncbi:hypothetical protein [Nonomuraea diastatica]|uniref:hypothetical protein n=1 Tax=Nonomuraea diastatica TaxID=1848329 RepID=UPI00140A211F|nr:hypothetical protein [Nonomuraea diastatica]
MKLPADWETESGSGYWSHLAHLTHKPCGFRTGMAFDRYRAGGTGSTRRWSAVGDR